MFTIVFHFVWIFLRGNFLNSVTITFIIFDHFCELILYMHNAYHKQMLRLDGGSIFHCEDITIDADNDIR